MPFALEKFRSGTMNPRPDLRKGTALDEPGRIFFRFKRGIHAVVSHSAASVLMRRHRRTAPDSAGNSGRTHSIRNFGFRIVADFIFCDKSCIEELSIPGWLSVQCSSPCVGKWEKLMEEGIIPKSEKSGFRHIDLLDLAEQIISLASAKLAKGNKGEADILGMWYMFLPTFCSEIEPEDGEYDQEKIDILIPKHTIANNKVLVFLCKRA